MLLKLVGVASMGLLAAWVVRIALLLNFGRQVVNHQPGPCRTVQGIKYGSEDIELIDRLNCAFITSGLYYMSARAPEVTGKIFMYNYSQPRGEHNANEMKIEGELDQESFHPHGLSSYIVDGQILLYVINHDNQFKHSVEVFRYDEYNQNLKHLRTIADPKFVRPNNLVVVGKDQFLLTNDGRAQSAFWNVVEALFGFKTGTVIFYDGKESHVVLEQVLTPNGIAIDKQKKHIFVASHAERDLTVYTIAEDFKSVELKSRVWLDSMPDNVHLDASGDVWIGAHPVLFDLAKHNAEPDNAQFSSPSQVLRVSFSEDFASWKLSEPYANDGTQLSASTVAVPYYGQLLIGSIYRSLVHCDIAHSSVL